jgi:hypothetical protein
LAKVPKHANEINEYKESFQRALREAKRILLQKAEFRSLYIFK